MGFYILNDFTYYRGFYFSCNHTPVFPGFKTIEFNNYSFNHHHTLDVYYIEELGFSLLVAGTLLDIREDKSNTESSFYSLVEKIKSGLSLYDEVDFFSGRYVILCVMNGSFKFFSDATGMKSIFYSHDFKAFSSHCKILLALGYGSKKSLVELHRLKSIDDDGNFYKYRYGYPGFLTPYDGIFILPPNFEINIPEKNISRYFPRENLITSKDQIYLIKKINTYMKNQVSSLLSKGIPVYCSLTAGLDSRFTLSATQGFDNIEYFTYRYPENSVHEIDVISSKKIAEIQKLSYRVLDLDDSYNYDSGEFKILDDAISKNIVYSPHGKKISYVYLKEFGVNNYLIRSNLYEIGQVFFHNKVKNGIENKKLNRDSLRDVLTYCYNSSFLGDNVISSSFNDYIEKSTPNDIFGYDILDLFYWEHRMGIWHSQVVIESDPAFETIVLCNAREIIKIMLSLPLADRKKLTLFNSSIKSYLPKLNNIPINKTP